MLYAIYGLKPSGVRQIWSYTTAEDRDTFAEQIIAEEWDVITIDIELTVQSVSDALEQISSKLNG
jgi:chemotaxis response regulator CheB